MMKKITIIPMIIAALAMPNAFANAEAGEVKKVAPSSVQNQAKKTWLGVSLSAVPEILFTQLGNVIPKNQGVMIQSVSPNSPAAKAGLQAYDILLGYNDQQLYSDQQLSKLVASSKAKTEITLAIVRNATKQDIKVKLGSKAVALSAQTSRHPVLGFDLQTGNPQDARNRHPVLGFNLQPNTPQAQDYYSRRFGMPNFSGQPFFAPPPMMMQPQQHSQKLMPSQPIGQGNVMQQFSSLQIKSLDGERYHAEVEYQINDGEKKKFSFEGKQDEIRKQIKDHKELPESKKSSLLNALSNNNLPQGIPGGFMNYPQMPAFPSMPTFGGGANNAPTWFGNKEQL